jgi:cyclophilin family peptidyl-prolyl cis-trans isomerase
MRKTLLVLSLLALAALAFAQPAPEHGSKEQPLAVIETNMGNLNCVLFPKAAPLGVASFVGLAKGTRDWTDPKTGAKKHGVPLYTNTTFHRVIPEFMIQGGDPAGTGAGGPGYEFKNEVWPDLKFDRPGRLAYANSGKDTNGSQFFITELPYEPLNGNYTIFGQCDDASVELVKKIARVPRNRQNDMPLTKVVIKRIRIDTGAPAAAATKPAVAKPAVAKKPAAAAKQ